MLNYYQSAMVEMINLAPPRFIMPAEYLKPPEDGLSIAPKIAAEKLLRSVLPEDLCVSLSALNECEVQGKKYRYKIFKGQKTHCFQGDKTFSCCIHLSDANAPDTDRIVAEFLLIRNDEEQYLKIANLTQISGPRAQCTEADGLAFRREQFAYTQARIGDTITVRRPPRYAVNNGRVLNIQTILMVLLDVIVHHERMSGLRFPVIPEHDWFPGMTVLSVNVDYDIEATDLSVDDFRARYLQEAAERIVEMILQPGQVVRGFYELPIPGGLDMGGRVRDPQIGVCLRMTRAYDIRRETYPTRIELGVISETYG